MLSLWIVMLWIALPSTRIAFHVLKCTRPDTCAFIGSISIFCPASNNNKFPYAAEIGKGKNLECSTHIRSLLKQPAAFERPRLQTTSLIEFPPFVDRHRSVKPWIKESDRNRRGDDARMDGWKPNYICRSIRENGGKLHARDAHDTST